MSLFDLFSQKETIDQPSEVQPYGATDVMSATYEKVRTGDLFSSQYNLINEGRELRDKAFVEALASRSKDMTYSSPKLNVQKMVVEMFPETQQNLASVGDEADEFWDQWIDQYITQKRAAGDEAWNKVLTSKEIKDGAVKTAKEAEARAQEVLRGSPGGLITGLSAIAGGAGAAITDMPNVIGTGASMVLMPARIGLLGRAGIEAAINAGIEVASFKNVQEWQEELGNEYGVPELVQNSLLAALAGGAITVGGAIIPPVFRAGADVTKQAYWKSKAMFGLSKRLDDVGFSAEAGVMSRMARDAYAKEVDPSAGGVFSKTDVEIAMREINDAAKEGRAPKFDALEWSAKAMDQATMKPFKSLAAEEDFAKIMEARSSTEPLVEANVDLGDVPDIRSKSIIEPAIESVKKRANDDIAVATELPELEEFWQKNQDFTFVDESGKEVKFESFKADIDKINRITQAIASCGGL